jgi:hypothetical protein
MSPRLPSRNQVLAVGFGVIFAAALCFGLYLLMIEVKFARGQALFFAVALFLIFCVFFLWAIVEAIRNPSKDPQAGAGVSPELYESLTTGAKIVVGSPLSIPLALIAVLFRKVKRSSKKE